MSTARQRWAATVAPVLEQFSLSAFLEALRQELDTADAHPIALEAARRLTGEQIEQILPSLLENYIRSRTFHLARPTEIFGRRTRKGKSRWDEAGAVYKQILDAPERVEINGDIVRRPFGEFRLDMVRACATQKRAHAHSVIAIADTYDRVGDAMELHDAETPAELSEEILREVFGE